jgi:hypothetical protein
MTTTDAALQPLNRRCLSLTGAFETNNLPPGCFCAVAGDFDGQGMSYSALQWNLGQGTLQPLIVAMFNQHPALMQQVFGDGSSQLARVMSGSRSQQMTWARSLQSSGHALNEPWKSRFQALGATPEFQDVATRQATAFFQDALALCRTLGLKSQRAAALMFDIKVQNGGIGPNALTLIEQDFAMMPPGDVDVVEVARMRAIANRVADSANIRWREDVRQRKLTVANGTGVVHGLHYDLAAQFGLTLSAWAGC